MIFVENQVLKVESDLILVIFMGESRKWLTPMLCFIVGNDGGSDAWMEGDKKIGTYLLPDLH